MRIVIISKEFPHELGGVSDYTYQIAHRLVEQTQNKIWVITAQSPKIIDSPSPDITVLPIVKHWDRRCISVIYEEIKKINHIYFHLLVRTYI